MLFKLQPQDWSSPQRFAERWRLIPPWHMPLWESWRGVFMTVGWGSGKFANVLFLMRYRAKLLDLGGGYYHEQGD